MTLTRTKLCSLVAMAFGGAWASSALAQQAAPPAPAVAPQQLERVEITGSSIKRIDAETALPVQVITREQIQRTGAVNVEQLLQSVSSMSSSNGLTAASASGATTGGISAISLHGLGSIRTLVLVNGRRVAPYGIGFTGDSVSVDVNSIPLAAIERIEVLKDGASAIYGSDAIAGVVNFILRQDYKGAELTAEYGDTSQGGASVKRVTGTFGFGDLSADRYNVLVVASYQKEGSLFGADRSFANSGINVFANNDTTSGNTFPANIAQLDGSGTLNPSAPGCPGPYAVNDPLFPPTRCRFDPSPQVTLIPASERASIFAAAKYAITPDIQAYAEASYNRNTIRTIIQPVPLSDQFNIPFNNALCSQAPYNTTVANACVSTIILRSSSPFYPAAYLASQGVAGNPDLLVRYRAQTGNRDLTDINEAPRFVAGVKGTAVGWDFDVAGLYSESMVREHDNAGFPLNSQILPLLNGGTVNFFGPNTAAVQDQLNATQFIGDAFKIKSSLTSLTAKGSRDVYQLPAGPIGIAVGVEGRKEKLDFQAAPPLQTGDVSGYGGNFLDSDRSRNVGAVYSEINVPIVKNLELDGAIRYDHYEGVGNSTTPKASLRWQPIPQVLFRTSYGRGFRAPSLQELFLGQTTGVTAPGLSDPKRCPTTNSSNDCQTQFAVAFGGLPSLQPEKSRNFTLGTVLEPVNNVSLGVDYFSVRLDNTIVNGISPAVILSDTDKYASFITRAPQSPSDIAAGIPGSIISINQINLNLGSTKVAGYDIDASYRIPTQNYGRFTIGGSATYFTQYDTSNPDGSFTSAIDQANSTTGGVIARFRSYLATDWTIGPWGVTVAQNFQKGYHDFLGTFEDNTVPGFVERRVRDYVTYDMQGRYAGFKSWRFTLGVKNLFNEDPPYTNAAGQTSFQSGYDPQYGDPRGRFIYGRVTYVIQ